MESNYEAFMKSDLREYTGMWVAISSKGVIASGDNAKIVMAKAKKLHPEEKVILVKVPEEGTMIY